MSVLEKTLQQERYRINYEFGSVGNAKIYRAYDNILKTQVVLKEVSQKTGKDNERPPIRKTNFVNEAKILTTIKHDSLPTVHDYFSETDNHYLVLELIDGNDLAQLLEKNKKPFSVAQVTRWADQLFGALDYLHRQSPPIIHLAVKPQNIKLTDEGKIRLYTFGDADISSEQVNAAFMNQTAEVSDLPYLPIEQIWKGLDSASRKVILGSYDEKSEAILEQPADARADIYAVGATLYYLLTGILPADALTRSIDLLEGKTDPLSPPHQVNPLIPETISQLVMRAMEIKRENRFDSTAILRQVWRSAYARIAEIESQEQKQKAEAAAQAAKIAEQQRIEAAKDQRLKEATEQKRLAEAQLKAEREKAAAEREKAQNEFERQREAEEITRQKRQADAPQAAVKATVQSPQIATSVNFEIVSESPEPTFADLPIVTAKAKKKLPEVKKAKKESVKTPNALPTFSQINDAKMDQMFSEENISGKKQAVSAPSQVAANFDNLFAVQPENSGSFRRTAIIAGIFVVLGCAAVGIWFWLSAQQNKIEANEMVPAVTLSEPSNPAPITEDETPPNNEQITVSAPAETQATAPDNTDAPNNTGKRPVFIPAAAPHITKQSAPIPAKQTTVKPTAAPKKPVTADDLINDN